MSSTRTRPLGVTIIALIVMSQGVFGIIIGLNLTGVLDILAVPDTGSVSSTGAALLIMGVVGTIIGIGLFSLRFWLMSSPSGSSA